MIGAPAEKRAGYSLFEFEAGEIEDCFVYFGFTDCRQSDFNLDAIDGAFPALLISSLLSEPLHSQCVCGNAVLPVSNKVVEVLSNPLSFHGYEHSTTLQQDIPCH